jgi:hypothetical protein
VNKNVTTPEGAAAADTLTGFHKERGPIPNIDGSGPVTGFTCFETNFRESQMSSISRQLRKTFESSDGLTRRCRGNTGQFGQEVNFVLIA